MYNEYHTTSKFNMFKAYHTNRKKQEKNKLLSTSDHGPHCDYRCSHPRVSKLRKNGAPRLSWSQWKNVALDDLSIEEMEVLLSQCKPSDIQVLSYLIEYCSSGKTPSMSRERIARTLGYSIRTVSRSVTRLEKLGFIDRYYRHMTTTIYKVHYAFRRAAYQEALQMFLPSLRAAFLGILLLPTMLLSMQPKPLFFSNHGYAASGVPLLNKKKEDIYIPVKITEPEIDRNSYFWRSSNARLIDFPKNSINGTERNGLSRSEINSIWECNVKQNHYEYYKSHQQHTNFKEIIQSPELHDILFSKPHKEIQAFLGLTDVEAVKMFAYDDRVLQAALPTVESLAKGTLTQEKINDRLGWIMGLLKRKAAELSNEEHQIVAQWPFCWKIMETLGIDRTPTTPRSFAPPYNRPKEGPRSEYIPRTKSQQELIEQLQKDIAKFSEIVANPDKHLDKHEKNAFMSREFFTELARKTLKNRKEELEEILNS